MDLKEHIRSIQDYPKKGILFRDITTLIKNEKAFKYTIDQIVERSKKIKFDNNIYMPLLKSIGNISESVDINSRKFKISDSTLSFYNYKYDSKNFLFVLSSI